MLINAIEPEKEKSSQRQFVDKILRSTYYMLQPCKEIYLLLQKLYIILTMKNIFCFLTLLLSLGANAQITERTLPVEWKNLIDGGRFKDRFLPMPDGKSGENVWGTDSVRLRYVDNGMRIRNFLSGEETFSKVRITNTISLSADGRKTRPKAT